MTYEENVPRKLWVYNDRTNRITRKTLTFRSATHESWFDGPNDSTFDPAFVDENKEVLKKFVLKHMREEISDCEKALKYFNQRLKKLSKQ